METDRIIFRLWRDEDAEALYKYASDPEVGPRAGWPPHKSVEESLEIIRTIFHSDHMWAIELKETGEPIGCMGYMVHGESNIDIGENDAEVGYWIARPYWNRGICTEALRLLIDYCFNVKGFHTLWADYFPDNTASGKVMEHCGFRDTGLVNRCRRLQLGSDKPVRIMKIVLLVDYEASDVEYTETVEHIFSSNIETINTVGNVFFTEKVAEFYHLRHNYKENVNDSLYYKLTRDDSFSTLEGLLEINYYPYAIMSNGMM